MLAMRYRYKPSVALRSSWFASLALIILAVGCAPSISQRQTIDRDATSRPTEVQQRTNPGASGVVIVRKGDSLYKIARRYDVSLRDLIEINRATPPYYIYEGQRIRLPHQQVHVVQKGETLYSVSRRYGIDMAALVRANKIPPPYRISAGARISLPGGSEKADESVTTTAQAARAKAPVAAKVNVPAPSSPAPSKVVLTKLPPRSGARFLWPVVGQVIVGFGPRAGGLHNDGINILARHGAAVKAAENGVVAYSGNELRGFGNLLLVKHKGGWMSAYAHNARLLVKAGQRVRRGQTIAQVGSTGSVSRPQLHFELRRGVRVVNPINHLQPLRAQTDPVRLTASLAGPPNPE
jgi:murein DD-endopeptidase MepM/ murein hydrolase activator NlpD